MLAALAAPPLALASPPLALVQFGARAPRRAASARLCADADAAAAIEEEMLRKIEGMARAGMTQEEILSSTTLQQMAATQLEKGGTELADDLKANPPANPFVEGVDARSQAAMPRRGVTRGVRWEHGERSITLEFEIDDDVRAKQIACELGEGFLCVQVPAESTPPRLFGRLAQPVHPEVLWSVDEDGDGRRLLCVELEKTARNTGPAVADCVFDESLAIDGESVVEDGLSRGTISFEMPEGLK